MGYIFDDDFTSHQQGTYTRQCLTSNRPVPLNCGSQPQQQPQQQPPQHLPQQHLPQQHTQTLGQTLGQTQLQHGSYPQHSTIKIEINPFEIFSCNKHSHIDDCTIFTFRLARQNVVLLTDEHQSSQLTSLVPIFYSELNNASLESLSLSDITLKYGGTTYTSHEFCPPYEITKTGKKIKIPLVLKNEHNQVSSEITLLIWGCSKNNKNSNLKNLFINGIIIDETNPTPDASHAEDIWNNTKLISSSDNQVTSKTNSSSQSHDW